MAKYQDCVFEHIDDVFTFGKYSNMTLSDVIEIDPNYIEWCQKNTQNVILLDSVIEEIQCVYPDFPIDYEFEEKRQQNLELYYADIDCEDDIYTMDEEYPTFCRYNGSWAQDVEGYSDDDIDTIFDGDPIAYWNID